MLLTAIIFIFVLSVLVFVHELGHFAMARKFGVKSSEFGMGLPPRIFGLQKLDGKWRIVGGKYQPQDDEPMILSLNWIPIGGFVNIKGENGEVYAIDDASDEVTAAEHEGGKPAKRRVDDSFGSKKIWQRVVILAAGVTMNLILCVLLLSLGYAVGMPTAAGESIGGGHYVRPPEVQVTEVLAGYPAAVGGMKPGDIILAVDGLAISDSTTLKDFLVKKENATVAFKIQRNQEVLVENIAVKKVQNTVGIGVAIADIGIVRYPLYLALWEGIKGTFIWLSMIGLAILALFRQLFGGASAGVDFTGPVGIAVMTGQAAKLGWIYILQFMAMLSLNLAIINILPFPALDGGRILFLAIEKVRGKAVGPKIENFLHNLGFALLMLLVAAITYRDILRYGGKIFSVLRKSIGL